MPLLETKGAASAQGFGLTLSTTVANYIEEVFSIYLYTGTGATLSINNGIDLSTKGGLLWTKERSAGTYGHRLTDTARGGDNWIATDSNGAQNTVTNFTIFNTNGFTLDSSINHNESATTYASWTFREQPKFFDVVTYTGTGANRTISHNLGSVPGCIIVKRTDTGAAWAVYHRSLANTQYLVLNTTAAAATGATWWNSTTPTSSVFSLGTDASVNASGGTYVAYIYAHDAGGFGLTGSDNVISCGSFTTDGSGNASVTLGYEPQWVLFKKSLSSGDWKLADVMRGFNAFGWNELNPNTSSAESVQSGANILTPTATGFIGNNSTFSVSSTYIYIAIRRGPMKVPTTGTSVFQPIARTGTGAATTQNTTITGDLGFQIPRNAAGNNWAWIDRLRGQYQLQSSTAAQESDTAPSTLIFSGQTDFSYGGAAQNQSGQAYILEVFKRAPRFFDEVCYTGTGSGTQTISHNLGVTPELTINKSRSDPTATRGWTVYYNNTTFLRLNQTNAGAAESLLNPTTTTFDAALGAGTGMNAAETYVTYLFATCPGVSKVGTYTGTGTTLQINCGFSAGSRFVLIKRSDSTGDWYVWDSARGIVAGNDPYLLLNSTDAEVTGTDYVDTFSSGFEITSTAPAAINANGGTFIFLAIA